MAEMTAPTSPVCPWCSRPLPSGSQATCPSCGATLHGDTEPQLPGVTAIDAEAIVRAARAPAPARRSRLLSWISGDYDVDEPVAEASPGSLGPPPPDVAREMLRLELEAEVANLQAEAEALRSEEEVDAADESAAADDAARSDEALTADDPIAPAGTDEDGPKAG